MSPLFLVGALSVLAQVVLLRELNVAFFGVELVYLVALAMWLAGTALGSILLPRRLSPSRVRLAALLAVVAGSLPLEVAAVRASRRLLGGLPGAFLPVGQQALVLAAAVLPPAMLLGTAFRWSAQMLPERQPSRLARGYAVESLGAAAAGLLATLAFRFGGVQTSSLALGIGGIGLAAFGLAVTSWRARLAVAAAAGSVTALLLSVSGGFDAVLTRLNHPALAFTADSPYGRFTVESAEGQRAVFMNDVLVHESGSREPEALAHLAALQHPGPARTLVLGGTLKGLDDLLEAHGPTTIVVVEIDPVVAAMWRADHAQRASARRARSQLVVAEPRAFLKQPGTFDLIVVGAGGPDSGLDNRFFTKEFFAACALRMAPGAVLGVALPLPDAFLSPLALLRAASIVRALEASFPSVQVLPATSTVAVASRETLPDRPDTILARLAERHLDARLVSPAYVRYAYDNDRRERLPAALAAATAVANSDRQPVCFQHAALLWLSKFFPALQRLDPAVLASPSRWPSSPGSSLPSRSRRWRPPPASTAACARCCSPAWRDSRGWFSKRWPSSSTRRAAARCSRTSGSWWPGS